jgi:phosphate starvation-inducible PhoH-like protein
MITSDNGTAEKVEEALHVLADILEKKEENYELEDFDLKYVVQSFLEGRPIRPGDLNRMKLRFPETGRTIVPRTANQAGYLASISRFPVTFGIGPAGTGKTFLAVAAALARFQAGEVERIILTRPAVEAGESLGFLPGDFIQKINPYLRPLYDALFELFPGEKVSGLIERGMIEIAPLAYMRGRTLNNAFIILDEAQNTSISQMKMFLTRLGNNSRIVISGDITQIDLTRGVTSGLIHAGRILKKVDEIAMVYFTAADISRHPVVEKIVAAYEGGEG